jgi:hypothetical protein
VEEFATPGWRVSPSSHGRQYEDAEVTDRDGTALLLRDWLVRRLKSGVGFIAIIGVIDVDTPAIEFDRVDGATRLDQQIDRLGDLVLAASGWTR